MTAKRERVICGVRAAIMRGDYADGHHLSQDKLAEQYGVGRSVVSWALAVLQDEGHVSTDAYDRFRVNASHATRQLQMVLNRLAHVERLTSRALVALGQDPADLRRRARPRARLTAVPK